MKQHDFVLRVPATKRGELFIDDLREYLNDSTYKIGKLRYGGKRVTGFAGHVRKEDANIVKVYINDKRKAKRKDVATAPQAYDTVNVELGNYHARALQAENQLRIIKEGLIALRRKI